MPGPILTPLNARSAAAALVTMREQHALVPISSRPGWSRARSCSEAQTEARNVLGIPILGHLPNGIDVVRASGEGMKSIEHLGPGVASLPAAQPSTTPSKPMRQHGRNSRCHLS